MKTSLISFAVAVAAFGHGSFLAGADPAATAAPPFYAQACFYEPDPRYRTLTDQIKLLAELGYDGYSHIGLDGLPEVLKAVDETHLKLFQLYAFVSIDPEVKPKYDPRLKEAIKSLKGRETIVGLLISGKPPSTTEWDPQAVEIIREIADTAAASKLRVALYPHQGSWLERVQDGVRVAKKTDRKNVGVVFSEVHFFLCDEEKNLAAALEAARPFLYVVNVNGTDGNASKDLARVLQPLDRGSFDNLKLLKLLRKQGYTGPIGFHGYMIHGDVRENLIHTKEAWRKLSVRLHDDNPHPGRAATGPDAQGKPLAFPPLTITPCFNSEFSFLLLAIPVARII
jgi:sugar phosphate isomerase/epimerase